MKNNILKILTLVLVMVSASCVKAQCIPGFTYALNPNGNVTFTSTSIVTNSVTSYFWNFGNSQTYTATGLSGVTASVNYTANGIYTVTLFFSTPPSCSNTISQTISVVSVPTCALLYTVAPAASATVCNGSAGVTSPVGLCGSPTYTWLPGSLSGATVTNLCPGTYTVFASSISGTNCCSSASAAVTVSSSNCFLNANFAVSQSSNGLVIFTNASTGTIGTTTYTWSFGDNTATSNSVSPVHTYSANGTYIATLTASNNTSLTCTSTKTLSIVVNSYCTLSAGFNYVMNTNGNVSFLNTTTPSVSVTYTWNFGSAASSFVNPAFTFTANGTYTVTLTAASTNTLWPGCISSSSAAITVTNVIPCLISPNFTHTQGANGLVNFSNLSTGTVAATSYTWNFGDNSANSNLVSPAHTYTANGTYSVKLLASNNFTTPCIDSLTIPVVVNSNCNLTASFTYSLGSGGYVNFINTSTGTTSATNYTWSFGNSTFSYNVANPNVTYLANGTYTVLLYAQLNPTSICNSSTTQIIVINNTNPCALAANFTNSWGNNGLINFVNNSTGTIATTSYTWNFGDGSPASNQPSPSHTYSLNGNYTITLTANNNGTFTCLSTKTLALLVNTNCNLNAAYSYTLGSNGSVLFFNSTSSPNPTVPVNYFWNFGNTFTSTAVNPIVTFTSNGIYTVTLNAIIYTYSCSSVSTQTISITNVGVCNLNAGITHTLGSAGLVNFGNTSTGTTANTTYTWNFGDGWTSNLANPSHTYLNSGTHYVSLVAMNSSSCVDTVYQAINITGVTCMANSNFSLSPTSTPKYWTATPAYPWNVTNAIWSWGDNSSSSGLYVSHQYSVAGNYNVCLSVTVSCAASSTSCATYSISRPAPMDIIYINVAEPTLVPQITGVQGFELQVADYVLFPNPNDGLFTLRLSNVSPDGIGIQIYNQFGEKILSENCAYAAGEVEKVLDLKNEATGVYFVEWMTGSRIYRQKIIISR